MKLDIRQRLLATTIIVGAMIGASPAFAQVVEPAPGTPDALMGWNSQPDTLTQVHLHFATKEEAIAYATAKKLEYVVSEPKKRDIPPKAYAENFSNRKRTAFDGNC